MLKLDPDLTYLPNGELNITYVVSQARTWLNEGRMLEAGKAFQMVAQQSKSPHLGWYGLGQCLSKGRHFEKAVLAFQRAFAIEPKIYIVQDWIEALIASGRSSDAEELSLRMIRQFAENPAALEALRALHRKSIGH
jgi:hypothetical protein